MWIRGSAKTVGYDPTLLNSKARTAVYQMNQARKLMHLARRTKHKQGRCNDDRAGFVEGLMTGFAPSPETAVEKNGAPTTKMLLRALGFNEESNAAKRLFKVAVDKRKRLRESIGVDGSVIAWLLYTSDAADDLLCSYLGGSRTMNKTIFS